MAGGRRKRILIAGVLLALLGGGAWLWSSQRPPPRATSSGSARNAGGTAERDAELGSAMQALLGGAVPPARGTLTIEGTVLGRSGKPVAQVVVVATERLPPLSPGEVRAGPDERLSDMKGVDGDTPLLRCSSPEGLQRLVALVAARQGEAPVLARAVTGPDGRFVLAGLAANARVALWAEAGADATTLKEVTAGAVDVVLRLSPAITVDGQVSTQEKLPIPGAALVAIHDQLDRFFEATADASGRFHLGPLPSGEYTVVASAEGYLPECNSVVRESMRFRDGRFTLLAPRKLRGRVLEGDRPVAGAEIALEGSRGERRNATSGPDGRFELSGLAVGEYLVRAHRDGRMGEDRLYLYGTRDGEVTLVLLASGGLRGMARDPGGRAVAGVEVVLTSGPPLRLRRTAKVDAAGRYAFPQLTPGRWTLEASAEGYRAVEPSLLPIVADETAVRDLVLDRGTACAGEVVDEEGKPVEGVVVAYRPSPCKDSDAEDDESERDSRGGFGRTRFDGHFSLEGMVPGAGCLKVSSSHHRPLEQDAALPNGQLRLTVRRGIRFTVHVEDEQGLPVLGARVALLPRNGQGRFRIPSRAMPASTESDAAGVALVDGLEAGPHLAMVQFGTGGDGTTTTDLAITALAEVTADSAGELTVRPAGQKALSGRVVDREGQPVADVQLRAYPDQLPRPSEQGRPGVAVSTGNSTSGADGTFRMGRMAPGSYQLFASKDGYVQTHQQRVQAGTAEIEIVLEVPQRLIGRVLAMGGAPVARFELDGQPYSNPEGRYEMPLEQVAAGDREVTEHSFRVEAEGFHPATVRVRLDGRPEVRVPDVILSAGRRLTGRVIDAERGVPLAGVNVLLEDPKNPGATDVLTTWGDGRFVASNVVDGPISLAVRLDGYLPLEQAVPAGEVGELLLRLSGGARIEGKVFDWNGRPCRACYVRAEGQDAVGAEDDGSARNGSSDVQSDGSYQISGLRPGTYWLEASAPPGGNFGGQKVQAVLGPAAQVDLRPRLGGATVRVRGRMVDGATLEAGFLREGEVAVADFRTSINGPLPGQLFATGTDDQLLFRGVPLGKYTLFLVASGDEGPGILARPLELTREGEQALVVDVPATLAPFDLSQ